MSRPAEHAYLEPLKHLSNLNYEIVGSTPRMTIAQAASLRVTKVSNLVLKCSCMSHF
jgi:hypothetical protein